MTRYSAFQLIKNALSGNKDWPRAWRDPAPKSRYDVIIIGGGGHGLATAYYLAKNHGITNVAVLEKGYLGGGNVGRNTTIVRSNYAEPANTVFYEHSLKLWEGLSRDLNYNVMFSQRHVYNLMHSQGQMDGARRRGNRMRLMGVDSDLLQREDVRRLMPYLDFSDTARFPIWGALVQKRAGNARHDAVAWGFAQAADQLGVDLIQNCEVTGFQRDSKGAITGVQTTRGDINAGKVGMAVAGNTSHVARMAGLELPIESHLLQAFVTEAVKPMVDHVVTFGAGHFYVSQSDKGGLVFGASLDGYNSYAARGNLPMVREVMEEGKAMIPMISRLKVLRHWGGIMDMSMDGSPIICKAPIDGLYLNCGWCYGGFKATPGSGWAFAWTIANDAPHKVNERLTLNRFERGIHIDELGAGPTPGYH